MGGVPSFLGGVPGFLGDIPSFLAGVPGFSGVPECSVMFRCSGVPGSTTCPSHISAGRILSISWNFKARSLKMSLKISAQQEVC